MFFATHKRFTELACTAKLQWRIYAHALILSGLVSLFGFSSAVKALILAPSDPIEMSPGELLIHIVHRQRNPGARVEVRLIEAPVGAQLVVDQSGELNIRWQSGPDMPVESVFVLIARNIDTQQELDRRQVLVVRKADPLDQLQPVESILRPALEPSDQQYLQVGAPGRLEIGTDGMIIDPVTLAGARQTLKTDSSKRKIPRLNSMPNQIISAGRVVSFQVEPVIDDGNLAIVQVDRLPRNASFDENQDGSRTFYWQTSDEDQGEHLFRFTVIHPESADLRAWREILIVVGDPSRSSTAPADELHSSIE